MLELKATRDYFVTAHSLSYTSYTPRLSTLTDYLAITQGDVWTTKWTALHHAINYQLLMLDFKVNGDDMLR